jgi:hypothetical protein
MQGWVGVPFPTEGQTAPQQSQLTHTEAHEMDPLTRPHFLLTAALFKHISILKTPPHILIYKTISSSTIGSFTGQSDALHYPFI